MATSCLTRAVGRPLGRVSHTPSFLLLCFSPRQPRAFMLYMARRLRMLAGRLAVSVRCPPARGRPPLLVPLCRCFTQAANLPHSQLLCQALILSISSTTWTSRRRALLVKFYEWAHVGGCLAFTRMVQLAPADGRQRLARGSRSAGSRPLPTGRVGLHASCWRSRLPTRPLPQDLLDYFCLVRAC